MSHWSVTCSLFGTATRPVGAGHRGVAVTRGAAPGPESFTARTANVYAVPLVRPVTVVAVVAALLPSISAKLVPPSALTWYLIIVLSAEPSQVSATSWLRAVGVRPVGPSGTGAGVAVLLEGRPVITTVLPDLSTACTVKVYSVPLVRGEMVVVVVSPDPAGT